MRTVQMTRAMFGAMLLGSLVLATSAQAQTIAITGGTVYPVSGPKIEKGTVVIRDGTIVAVGAYSWSSSSSRTRDGVPGGAATMRR